MPLEGSFEGDSRGSSKCQVPVSGYRRDGALPLQIDGVDVDPHATAAIAHGSHEVAEGDLGG